MQENDEIDILFKEGLSKVHSFDREAEQWETVSQRLKKDRRAFLFWLIPFVFGMVIIGGLIYNSTIGSTATDHSLIQSNQSIDTPPNDHESMVESNPNSVHQLTKPNSKNENKAHLDLNSSSKSLNLNSTTQKSTTSTSIAFDKPDNKPPLFNHDKSNLYARTEHKTEVGKTDINDLYRTPSALNDERSVNESNPGGSEIGNKTHALFPLNLLDLIHPFVLYENDQKIQIHATSIPICLPGKTPIRFRLNAGLFSELLVQDSLDNQRTLGISTGIRVQYSKYWVKLGYRYQSINRAITSQLSTYNIEDFNFIYGYGNPYLSTLSYKTHHLDLSIGYSIYSFNRFQLNIHSGLQMRKIGSGQIESNYESYNDPIVLVSEIPSRTFELSDARIGTQLEYFIHRYLHLYIDYNLIMPIREVDIKWPRRHQLEVGLFYHLN
ncbi:MAG: hypothetical protein P1U56_05270 [Saprospiraceae bacterium]|nr:hypothetical protein [Saprospiraceae bacterium]